MLVHSSDIALLTLLCCACFQLLTMWQFVMFHRLQQFVSAHFLRASCSLQPLLHSILLRSIQSTSQSALVLSTQLPLHSLQALQLITSKKQCSQHRFSVPSIKLKKSNKKSICSRILFRPFFCEKFESRLDLLRVVLLYFAPDSFFLSSSDRCRRFVSCSRVEVDSLCSAVVFCAGFFLSFFVSRCRRCLSRLRVEVDSLCNMFRFLLIEFCLRGDEKSNILELLFECIPKQHLTEKQSRGQHNTTKFL